MLFISLAHFCHLLSGLVLFHIHMSSQSNAFKVKKGYHSKQRAEETDKTEEGEIT